MFNWTNKQSLIEEVKGLIKNIENAKDEDGRWITVKGNHIFIREGETPKEATERFLKDKQEREEWFKEQQKEKQDKKGQKDDKSDLKGKYEDGDFDEAEAIKDIAKVKEMGLKTTEEIAEHLGLDEDEVRVLEEKAKSKGEDKKELSPKEIKTEFKSIIDKNIGEVVAEISAYYQSRKGWSSPSIEEFRKSKSYSDVKDTFRSVEDLPKSFMRKVYSLASELDSDDIKSFQKDPQAFRTYISEFGSYLFASGNSFSDWLWNQEHRLRKEGKLVWDDEKETYVRKANNSLTNTIAEAIAEVIIENTK